MFLISQLDLLLFSVPKFELKGLIVSNDSRFISAIFFSKLIKSYTSLMISTAAVVHANTSKCKQQ